MNETEFNAADHGEINRLRNEPFELSQRASELGVPTTMRSKRELAEEVVRRGKHGDAAQRGEHRVTAPDSLYRGCTCGASPINPKADCPYWPTFVSQMGQPDPQPQEPAQHGGETDE